MKLFIIGCFCYDCVCSPEQDLIVLSTGYLQAIYKQRMPDGSTTGEFIIWTNRVNGET